jgi:hypothetical protein
MQPINKHQKNDLRFPALQVKFLENETTYMERDHHGKDR